MSVQWRTHLRAKWTRSPLVVRAHAQPRCFELFILYGINPEETVTLISRTKPVADSASTIAKSQIAADRTRPGVLTACCTINAPTPATSKTISERGLRCKHGSALASEIPSTRGVPARMSPESRISRALKLGRPQSLSSQRRLRVALPPSGSGVSDPRSTAASGARQDLISGCRFKGGGCSLRLLHRHELLDHYQ